MTIQVHLPDSVYVVKVTDGSDYIPCLPYEDQSTTYKLKSDTIVKYIKTKELGFGNNFYVIEIIDSGDTVLLPISSASHLLRIPSKNKFR
jgi:hypothetical protein